MALECLHLLCRLFNANFPFHNLAIVLFSEIVIVMINSNKTSSPSTRSVIILVINKSDSRCAVAQICYHSYDYKPNRTPVSPITITCLSVSPLPFVKLSDSKIVGNQLMSNNIQLEFESRVAPTCWWCLKRNQSLD